MSKQKESWVCVECGNAQVKWSGSCFACKNWNTMEKMVEVIEKNPRFSMTRAKAVALSEVKPTECQRFQTGLAEVDRVFGGGVVEGSLSLLGGDPGIGKSTLMLMLADRFCKLGKRVLYVCGEESA